MFVWNAGANEMKNQSSHNQPANILFLWLLHVCKNLFLMSNSFIWLLSFSGFRNETKTHLIDLLYTFSVIIVNVCTFALKIVTTCGIFRVNTLLFIAFIDSFFFHTKFFTLQCEIMYRKEIKMHWLDFYYRSQRKCTQWIVFRWVSRTVLVTGFKLHFVCMI